MVIMTFCMANESVVGLEVHPERGSEALGRCKVRHAGDTFLGNQLGTLVICQGRIREKYKYKSQASVEIFEFDLRQYT